jgi:hypothetical protein
MVHPATLCDFWHLGDLCLPPEVRRLLSQTIGWQWAFQYAVASATDRSALSHASKRRPFRANDRRIFHHGSISLREAAWVGWKTTSERGWTTAQSSTSSVRWVCRLSRPYPTDAAITARPSSFAPGVVAPSSVIARTSLEVTVGPSDGHPALALEAGLEVPCLPAGARGANSTGIDAGRQWAWT